MAAGRESRQYCLSVRVWSDGCEEDCDSNGVPDDCDIASGGVTDKDGDNVPDSCEYARGDFDLDGEIGAADLATLLAEWGPLEP